MFKKILDTIFMVYQRPDCVPCSGEISKRLEASDGVIGSKQIQHTLVMAMMEQEALHTKLRENTVNEFITLGIVLVTVLFLTETDIFPFLFVFSVFLFIVLRRRASLVYTQIKHIQGYIDGSVMNMLSLTEHIEKLHDEVCDKDHDHEGEPVIR